MKISSRVLVQEQPPNWGDSRKFFKFNKIFDEINEKISYLISSIFTFTLISNCIFNYINLKNKK